METIVTIPNTQQSTDLEHLRLLKIFHFIAAGLCLAGLAFLMFHYSVMNFAMSRVDSIQKEAPFNPREFFEMFRWVYLFGGGALLLGSLLNLLSGYYISQRKNRVFSFVVAVLNCLNIPAGTALGVFAITVLTRESVKRLYGEAL